MRWKVERDVSPKRRAVSELHGFANQVHMPIIVKRWGNLIFVVKLYLNKPSLWYRAQSSWLQIQRSRHRFRELSDI
jgi:hypothetical protein